MCAMKTPKMDVDKLSSLPDTLLLEILSLLPINSAATTTVLSHRWRHLWTHLPHLSFDHLDFRPPQNPDGFIATVDHILSRLSSPKIQSFFIRWFIDQGELGSNPFLSWIPYVCARKPDKFTVNFSLYYRDPCLFIPSCVFVTQSLVELQLCCQNVDYELPDDGIIELPNLKKLSMRICDSDHHLMGTLFKSCPSLEFLDLRLYLEENDHVVHILAPNLRSLALFNSSCHIVVKHLIDAPKLEFVSIAGCLASYHFDCIPETLLVVELGLSWSWNELDGQLVTGLLRGISCVRSLTLSKYVLCLLNDDLTCGEEVVLPVFNNLMHLKLTGYSVLCGTPIPAVLLTKLKKVNVMDVRCRGEDFSLLEYILSHATALEHFRVSFDTYNGSRKDQLWEEYEFCKELSTLLSSVSCQIEFSGFFISASSNDLQNGLLASAQICFRD